MKSGLNNGLKVIGVDNFYKMSKMVIEIGKLQKSVI